MYLNNLLTQKIQTLKSKFVLLSFFPKVHFTKNGSYTYTHMNLGLCACDLTEEELKRLRDGEFTGKLHRSYRRPDDLDPIPPLCPVVFSCASSPKFPIFFFFRLYTSSFILDDDPINIHNGALETQKCKLIDLSFLKLIVELSTELRI